MLPILEGAMWQRFSEKARKVIFYAQEEAQKFGEGRVSTEHILLGLIRDGDTVAARVLDMLGVSLNRVRVEVERLLPQRDAQPNQDMSLTSHAKHVIDLSYDEARNLNNNYIGTEHLLLGLVREGDGLAGRVLAKLGVTLEKTRQQVIKHQKDDPSYQAGQGSFASPELSGTAMMTERQYLTILSRVKKWAEWANEFKDPRAPLEVELVRLEDELNSLLSAEQRSLLLALCLELAEGDSLEANENWKKLRITPEQAKAMAEIGIKVATALDDKA